MRQAADRSARAQRAEGVGSIPNPHSWQAPYAGQGWYPWFYYWDPRLEHRRLLDANVPAEEALKLEHRAACEGIPERMQELSPFESYAFGSARLSSGILLHLSSEAGPPEVLLVRLRCHEAWLRVVPRPDVSNDLMAVAGATLVVHAGGRETIEVMMSIADPLAVDELDRRAQIAVRRAKRSRARAPGP
jgi:hypothetical protein